MPAMTDMQVTLPPFAETTVAAAYTDYPAVTTCVEAGTEPPDPGSSGHSGAVPGGSTAQPGDRDIFEIPVMQAVMRAKSDGIPEGASFFELYDGADFQLPDAFAGFTLPDGVNPAEYNVLYAQYYGYLTDAVITDLEWAEWSGVDITVYALETSNTLKQYAVLLWIPKNLAIDPSGCNFYLSVSWNPDYYYRDMPVLRDVFQLQT